MKFRGTADAYQLLHDGSIALAEVESNGIKIDTDYLSWALTDTGNQIRQLEEKLKVDPVWTAWKRRFGERANLGSRDQLAATLFDVMGYPSQGYAGAKKKKRDDPGDDEKQHRQRADEAALKAVGIPFVDDYLRMEKVKKVRSTYLGGIAREMADGYLYSFFNLHTTITYRSSSDRINFQNIPIRVKWIAELIRNCFIPRAPNRRIVELDYKAIEVRIAACYHKDPRMIAYINDPKADMHRDMAAQIFFQDSTDLAYWSGAGETVRDTVKGAFVFAEFYGDYYKSVAKNLWGHIEKHDMRDAKGRPMKDTLARRGIDRLGRCDPKERDQPGTFERHIKEIEDDFWNKRFQVYGQWRKDWYASYLENGGFTTLTGFHIQGIYDRNAVINYPVQGSAFHCLLWALIRMQAEIKRMGLRAVIIGQIHDSIIADVPDDEMDDFLAMAKRVMTEELRRRWDWIIVPIAASAAASPPGKSWHHKEKIKLPA